MLTIRFKAKNPEEFAVFIQKAIGDQQKVEYTDDYVLVHTGNAVNGEVVLDCDKVSLAKDSADDYVKSCIDLQFRLSNAEMMLNLLSNYYNIAKDETEIVSEEIVDDKKITTYVHRTDAKLEEEGNEN